MIDFCLSVSRLSCVDILHHRAIETCGKLPLTVSLDWTRHVPAGRNKLCARFAIGSLQA